MAKLDSYSSQCLFIVSLDLSDSSLQTYSVKNVMTGEVFTVKAVQEYTALEDMSHATRVHAETLILSDKALSFTDALIINEAAIRVLMGHEEGYLFSSDLTAPVLKEIHVCFCGEIGGIILADANQNILVEYNLAPRKHDSAS